VALSERGASEAWFPRDSSNEPPFVPLRFGRPVDRLRPSFATGCVHEVQGAKTASSAPPKPAPDPARDATYKSIEDARAAFRRGDEPAVTARLADARSSAGSNPNLLDSVALVDAGLHVERGDLAGAATIASSLTRRPRRLPCRIPRSRRDAKRGRAPAPAVVGARSSTQLLATRAQPSRLAETLKGDARTAALFYAQDAPAFLAARFAASRGESARSPREHVPSRRRMLENEERRDQVDLRPKA
jgi:hypothetical protein